MHATYAVQGWTLTAQATYEQMMKNAFEIYLREGLFSTSSSQVSNMH